MWPILEANKATDALSPVQERVFGVHDLLEGATASEVHIGTPACIQEAARNMLTGTPRHCCAP